MAFNEQLPEWVNEGTKPPQSKINEGWQPTEKPPAQWFNWLLNRIYKAIKELQNKAENKDKKGQPGGYASLDGTGNVPSEQLGNLEMQDLKAKNIEYDNDGNTLGSDNVQGAIDELFTSVSNGKSTIAAAITDMNQSSSGSDKFTQMAAKIKAISNDANTVTGDVLAGKTFYQGGQKRTGTMLNHGSKSFTPSDSSQSSGAGYYSDITIAARPSLSGNATDAQVLTGRTYYGNNFTKQTGTMADRGATNHTLAINGSYIISAGYHNGSGKVTQSIPTQGSQTITPGTSNKTIASGRYLSGTQTIKGDANLKAENIVSGKSIFGVSGSYAGTTVKSRQSGEYQGTDGIISVSPVNPSNCIVVVQVTSTQMNNSNAPNMERLISLGRLLNSNSLEVLLQGTYAPGGDLKIYWDILEFSKLSSVQSGYHTHRAEKTTVKISNVNINNCLVLVTSGTPTTSSGATWYSSSGNRLPIARLINSTTLEFYSAKENGFAAWHVIEF